MLRALTVEAAADQHQSVSRWPEPAALVQSEALADEMEQNTLTRTARVCRNRGPRWRS
jgi:hypothetical protein